MREMSDIFSSSKKNPWNTIFSVFILIIPLIFGQLAHAQKEPVLSSQPYKINGKEVKEYLMGKYHLNKEDVRSEIRQTPAGPSGKFHFMRDLGGGINLKNIAAVENVQGSENRARTIANAFLIEDAELLGITNRGEIRERKISTTKGRDGYYTAVRYSRYIGDMELNGAYIWVDVGPDGSIISVRAELVPAPPELYEAVKKKTLIEPDIRKIVELDLTANGIDPKSMRILHIEEIAVSWSPYVIWAVDVNLEKEAGRWKYKFDAFTGKILEKRDALIIN